MLEIANIREHSSWVHQKDKKAATEKACDLVRMAVAKSIANEQLHEISVPVTKRALVIGGGIAGIQAALDIADAHIPVPWLKRVRRSGAAWPSSTKRSRHLTVPSAS